MHGIEGCNLRQSGVGSAGAQSIKLPGRLQLFTLPVLRRRGGAHQELSGNQTMPGSPRRRPMRMLPQAQGQPPRRYEVKCSPFCSAPAAPGSSVAARWQLGGSLVAGGFHQRAPGSKGKGGAKAPQHRRPLFHLAIRKQPSTHCGLQLVFVARLLRRCPPAVTPDPEPDSSPSC
jgi:hypothetical protein